MRCQNRIPLIAGYSLFDNQPCTFTFYLRHNDANLDIAGAGDAQGECKLRWLQGMFIATLGSNLDSESKLSSDKSQSGI